MDYMLDKVGWLLKKFGGKIPKVDIPWDKLTSMMDVINPYLAEANQIFPVDTLLTVLIIWAGLRAALFIIWTISFVRKLLPF
jgi:hypothetical protein